MVKREPRVVVVGGGFAGLLCARGLAKAPAQVTLVDRNNYHLFQPLLYQVAMAELSPADIAVPIRSVVSRQKNTRVLLDQVDDIDLAAHTVALRNGALAYDYLVVAAGATISYFGHNEWAQVAPGIKDLDDAVEMRRRVLVALEQAEREEDAAKQRALLTFIVIGGGPTGVELAGAVGELSQVIVARDFRRLRPEQLKVILLEGGPRLLASFPERLALAAQDSLRRIGVEVRLGAKVTAISPDGVHYQDGDYQRFVCASTVLWGAGSRPSALAQKLLNQMESAPVDRNGRVPVGADLSLASHPEVWVLGDMALFHQDGRPLPGVATVATQQGKFTAKAITASLQGRPRPLFRYVPEGNLATIGRSAAVADFGKVQFAGFTAWVIWLVVHIRSLIGFRNRHLVVLQWFWAFLRLAPGSRLITGHRLQAGPPS